MQLMTTTKSNAIYHLNCRNQLKNCWKLQAVTRAKKWRLYTDKDIYYMNKDKTYRPTTQALCRLGGRLKILGGQYTGHRTQLTIEITDSATTMKMGC